MDLQLALDRELPLRAQLERELRAAIRGGRLSAGAKLPSSRLLAGELGVSRGVVVETYAQLIAEGYLTARRGDATRIASGLAQPTPVTPAPLPVGPPVRYQLRSGAPDLSLFPRRQWQAAMTAVIRELPDVALMYGSRRGFRQLRIALNEYLARVRAAATDPDRLLVCTSAAHAMALLWHTLRERGATRVAVEDPTWPIIPQTISQAGLEQVPVTVDEHGLDVAQLQSLDADAVVLAPAHQYPTGTVLSPERRAALIAWARDRGALIVEDDYDAEYRYDREPVACLQGLAPDCVAYVGTASKTLAPGLRLGWVLPPDDLVADMSAAQLIRATPDVMTQAAYARLLRRGEIDRHLRRTRRIYAARRQTLISALAHHFPYATVGGADAGLHLILWLPDDADETAIAAAAARRGIAIETLHDFSITIPRPPALLLGYGLITEEAIPSAIAHLAAATAC